MGTGGENLSVKISLNPKCNTLRHEDMDGRTWSYDYFNKLFLKKFKSNWKDYCNNIRPSQLIDVVPSHYKPTVLRELFPDELYVVINYPKTVAGEQHLKKRLYDKVWMTRHKTLQQKIGYWHGKQKAGYWKTHPDKEVGRDILQKLNRNITNAEIHCLIHGVPATKENIDKIFAEEWGRDKQEFKFLEDKNLIAIEYEAMNDIQGYFHEHGLMRLEKYKIQKILNDINARLL